jgi:hypothetical protein
MFGSSAVPSIITAPNNLLTAVLAVAGSQIGIMEVPPGSNNGPDVNKYQDASDTSHGEAWCMALCIGVLSRLVLIWGDQIQQ